MLSGGKDYPGHRRSTATVASNSASATRLSASRAYRAAVLVYLVVFGPAIVNAVTLVSLGPFRHGTDVATGYE